MGKPGYEVPAARSRSTASTCSPCRRWQRAQAGLFLAMQYPTEVPGVPLDDVLTEALRGRGRVDRRPRRPRCVAEADRIGFDERFLDRPLNVDLSGGEKKRNETLQLGVLAAEDRDPRRARLRPRRRRAARLRPPDRGGDQRGRPRRAGHHPLQPAARTSCSPTTCTSWSRAASSPPAGPSWPTSSRRGLRGVRRTPTKSHRTGDALADIFG